MVMCRACLTTEQGMIIMDEIFLDNYNILTNLNVKSTDDVPLYTCTTCYTEMNFCIEFRNKCIASDETIKEISFGVKKFKYLPKEEDKNENTVTIKKEVALEYDDSVDNYSDVFIKYEKEDLLTKKIKGIRSKPNKSRNIRRKISNDFFLDESKIYCKICPETFLDVIGLTKHLDNHQIQMPCTLCGEVFANLPHLLGHRIEHLPDKQKRCHICSKKYLTAPNLEFHYMRIHELAEKDKPIECKKCNASFDCGKKLLRHNADQHSDIKLVCDHCSASFRNKTVLKAHMVEFHQAKLYECDLCYYTSKYSSGISSHKLRKHTDGRVYCKTCPRAFLSQSLLDKHSCKSAPGIICPICGIAIKRSSGSALKRHMFTHEDDCRYKCARCPAKFKTQSNYKIHMDKHAGTPRQQCEYCQRNFYSQSVLIKHRRTHTGEKPYVCTFCQRGFTGNHNLKVHMKVHGIKDLIKKRQGTQLPT